jgi:short-subunit dehydrogenase
MQLRDSVVVVTGASAGIGRATAERLARKGARVWAVARSEGALKELAAAHPNVIPYAADICDPAQRAALVEAAGPVDILVNNAGSGWTGIVEDMPFVEVRRLFELNVLALIDLTQQVLPGMLERRRGHVCNMASVAAWVSTPPFTVYCATKFAVQGFSEGLRRELRGRGVTVSTVNPGPVRTMFAKRAARGDRPTEELGTSRMAGVSPGLVAFAVERAIRMNGVPGWSTISVPRVVGLTRLGALPVVHLVVDAGALVSRQVVPRGRARPGRPSSGSG